MENENEDEIEDEKENVLSKKHKMDVAQVDRLHRLKSTSAADHENWSKGFTSALRGMLHLLSFWDADTGQVFNAADSADCENIAFRQLLPGTIHVDFRFRQPSHPLGKGNHRKRGKSQTQLSPQIGWWPKEMASEEDRARIPSG